MADVGVTSPFDALAALERFVVDNDDLLELESRIGTFNIFDALRIDRTEIRHSNFLAWLLDPNESHGLGPVFLKGLLMDVLKRAGEEGLPRALSPIELDGVDLEGVQIHRERHRIDLLVTCRRPEFIVVLENKVDSGEHGGQLAKYRGEVGKQFPGVARRQFVFLTRDGHAPGDPQEAAFWVPYSYQDVHRVFSRLAKANRIGGDVAVFLGHYLSLIGTRFMNDPSIDELCQRIYKNHRLALELIFDRAGSPGYGPVADVEAAVRADSRWHVFYRAAGIVDFIPAAWLSWMPECGTDLKQYPQSWFVFRFEVSERRLGFLVEIRRMSDPKLRSQVVDLLLSRGKDFGLVRKQKGEVKVKGLYTRVNSREVLANWPPDSPPEAEHVAAKVAEKLNALYPRMEELPDLLRPLVEGK